MRGRTKDSIGEKWNKKYCDRLVQLAFPKKPEGLLPRVRVGRNVYTSLELAGELAVNPALLAKLKGRYRDDPVAATPEELAAVAFLPRAAFGELEYTRTGLKRELAVNEELLGLLRDRLRHDPQPERVEEWVEAAFLPRVTVEEKEYTRAGLTLLLREHPEQVEKLKLRYHHNFTGWKDLDREETVRKVVEIALLPMLKVGSEEYTKEGLREALPGDPKLQQRVAVVLHFVPSKWLLEQERESCGHWTAETDGDIYESVARQGLTGLCFSGGGIRSATFNLGILQGLAQVGLLPQIDYLSSVSGGGYIHEFLAAWILRHTRGRQGVIEELIPQAEPGCLPRSPEPIKWLMRYASYLTPQRGPFSTDTWTMVAIWFRNTILNQIPMLGGFACAFLIIHLLVLTRMGEDSDFWTWKGAKGSLLWSRLEVVGALAMVAASLSLIRLGKNLLHQQEMHRFRDETATMTSRDLLSNGQVQLQVILPWLALSVWLSYWTQLGTQAASPVFWAGVIAFAVWIGATVMVVIFAGGAMDAHCRLHPPLQRRHSPQPGGWRKAGACAGFIAVGLLATLMACGLGWGFVQGSAWLGHTIASMAGPVGLDKHAAHQSLKFSVSGAARAFEASLSGSLGGQDSVPAGQWAGYAIDPWRIQLALLPGLLLSVPYIAIELTLGLVGRDYSDMRREWLARMRAWSLLYALSWFALVSLALLAPYAVYWLIGIGPAATWSAVVTFLAAHGATIFAGWSGKADGKPTDNGILGLKPMDLLAFIAAPITILGLLIAVSFCVSWSLDHLPETMWLGESYWRADALCCAGVGAVALLFGWRVDINEFSMQSFYRNRLSRCYLGATTPERQSDPFTGFDGRGKLMLLNGTTQRAIPKVRDLLPVGYAPAETEHRWREETKPYEGPFPIFCATLNLTTGQDLATQERKGASFAFTPLFSGYSVSWTDGHVDSDVSYNGYVPTEEYAYREQGISVDTAVAISGAAVNPNMGYNSNPALAFLMTFFNVRLGWWISNPRKKYQWPAEEGRATPRLAVVNLFQELFGKVNDAAPYVNLSDGGHFENMGLYELVRRRCRYIVVCDAEEDPEMKFEGMGAAITKCRSDFGADIDLDLRPLQIDDKSGFSKAHCVVGTIQYPPPPRGPDEDADEAEKRIPCKCLGDKDDDPYSGVIVYIKSSLVGDEPPDLLTYQLKHKVFPQDSTADQWFQETQFEAYRRLGHHVAMATIPPALTPGQARVHDRAEIPWLFRRLYAIWYPRTPEMEKYLGDHLKQYEGILKELRERKELVGLEARLNDATPWEVTETVRWDLPQGDAQSMLYPEQFANSVLDFMYTIYTDLKLAFPDNRVSPHAEWWICLFRRWCRVTLLKDAWTAHVQSYPLEFRLFALRELRLPEVQGYAE
jgi:hypothetical protein